jgi:multisubunit Na+/H+ antiporter MnhC subunit
MEIWRMEVLIPTLSAIAISTPVIIVWVIGIILALSRWRRHPRVSQFALIACAVMIINLVVGRFLTIGLPITMRDRGWTMSQIGPIFAAIGIITALISAAAWTLVICAIFGWRDQRKKENLFPPAPPTFGNEPREQHASPGFPQ